MYHSSLPPSDSSTKSCTKQIVGGGRRGGLHKATVDSRHAAANELKEQAVADEKMEAAHDEADGWHDYASFLFG
jgi:hypothetical protein